MNTAVNPVGQPGSPTVYLDRQWLGFGEGDRVYLAYSQWLPRTGVWTVVSEDAGETWVDPVPAHPSYEKTPFEFGSPGIPAVTDEAVVLPGYGWETVHVDVSTDGASSWGTHDVHELEDGVVNRWTVADTDRADRVHLAWTTSNGDLQYTRADDPSGEWADPATWTAGDSQADVPPSIAVDGNEVAITWFEEHGDGWDVHVARSAVGSALEGPEKVTVLSPDVDPPEGGDPHTDFAHADVTSDGRFVTTYSTGDSLQLAVEAPAGPS